MDATLSELRAVRVADPGQSLRSNLG